MELHFTLDGFRTIYAMVTTFMWLMALLASMEYMKKHENKCRFYIFTVLTYAATIGVFLSADLFTTFVCFEVMSLTSYVWVAQEEGKDSLRAAGTYLAIAIIGGLSMLMGLVMLYHEAGTTAIDALASIEKTGTIKAAGYLMLVGFGAKAGMFPLHIWLPKAHPVAPAPASALLSGVLTKAGVFGIVILTGRVFLEDTVFGRLLLYLGLATVLVGALLAIMSVNVKRILACSSVSQIGFILTGISMMVLSEEPSLAASGSFLYMMNHSLFKLTLFLIAGVIYTKSHSLDINRLTGFGRRKPLLHVLFLFGAAGIAGIPGFSGYVSKTMIHETLIGSGAPEWLFLLGGGFTFAYMLKLYIAIFIKKNSDAGLQAEYDSEKGFGTPLTVAAVTLSAVTIPILGLTPHRTMDRLAACAYPFFLQEGEAESVKLLTFENLLGVLISVLFGIIIYVLFVILPTRSQKKHVNLKPDWLDLEDSVYRPLLLFALPYTLGLLCRILDTAVDGLVLFLRKTIYRDCPIESVVSEGTKVTRAIGNLWDGIKRLYCRISGKKYNITKGGTAHRLALLRESYVENNRIISRSMSYGLLMFCLGLCITLVVLLFL